MKTFKSTHLALLLLFVVLTSFKNESKNDIIGKWTFVNSPKNSSPREIEIYVQDNKYFGKITKTSGEYDKEIIGHVMMKDFVYNQVDNNYTGKVNSPGGMTASGKLSLIDDNNLEININKFIISKTYILTRIN
ncbi:MAG: hypothetical protein WD607_09720 [Candidatus Paceibacterota bacterium]